MYITKLPGELLSIIAGFLTPEDLNATIRTCKHLRDGLQSLLNVKDPQRAATWAAARLPLETAETERSLHTLLRCTPNFVSREAVEYAVLFHLIVSATDCRRLAKKITRDSPLANFRLTRPITLVTRYDGPLMASNEQVSIGYIDVAAKFRALTIVQYLLGISIPRARWKEVSSQVLYLTVSVAVAHNAIDLVKELVKHGVDLGGTGPCAELRVKKRVHRPPDGSINHLHAAILHGHEEMVQFVSEELDWLYLPSGLVLARKHGVDSVFRILHEKRRSLTDQGITPTWDEFNS